MEIFIGAVIMFIGLVVGWGLGNATSRNARTYPEPQKETENA